MKRVIKIVLVIMFTFLLCYVNTTYAFNFSDSQFKEFNDSEIKRYFDLSKLYHNYSLGMTYDVSGEMRTYIDLEDYKIQITYYKEDGSVERVKEYDVDTICRRYTKKKKLSAGDFLKIDVQEHCGFINPPKVKLESGQVVDWPSEESCIIKSFKITKISGKVKKYQVD